MPGRCRVAPGLQRGAQQQRCGRVDLQAARQRHWCRVLGAARFQLQLQAIDPVSAACISPQHQPGAQLLNGRQRVNLQGVQHQLGQLQVDRQLQAGGGLQRLAAGWRAVVLRTCGVHPRQLQRGLGAWARPQHQPGAVDLQAPQLQPAGARGQLPVEPADLQLAAGQRAAHILRLQAGQALQQPGQGSRVAPGQPGAAAQAAQHQQHQRQQAPRQPAQQRRAWRAGGGGGVGGGGGGRGHGRARRTVRLVAQNVMPTEKCRRSFFKASAQARSMRSGPIGLRQRRPAP